MDRVMLGRLTQHFRQGMPEDGSYYYRLNAAEEARFKHLESGTALARLEQDRRCQKFKTLKDKTKHLESAAAKLEAAGVGTSHRTQQSLSKVKDRRANPTSWQNPKQGAFFASDWKARQAKETSAMRAGHHEFAADYFDFRMLRPNGDVQGAMGPPVKPSMLRSAGNIRETRAELFLPRSISD